MTGVFEEREGGENIWETKLILDSKVIHDEEKEEENKIKKQKKTTFVKQFFDKRLQQLTIDN